MPTSFSILKLTAVRENIQFHIDGMKSFIDKHGYEAFQDACYHGAWGDVLYDWVHPTDELRKTELFEKIHETAVYCFV